MSLDYWSITGYGICMDDIYGCINKEKVNKTVRELNPDFDFGNDDVFEDETFYGDPYYNIAHFFCELDPDNIFNYGDTGNGTSYLLFEPSYPWSSFRQKEPQTQEEVDEKIINLLMPYFDIPINGLKGYIRYIDATGCG